MRRVLLMAGLLVAAPMGGIAGLNHTFTTLLGVALAVAPFLLARKNGKQEDVEQAGRAA